MDFALTTPGFFCVQTEGGTVYTRNGSFALDEEGYLTLPTVGRVLGQNGPIQLPTDDIISDSRGEYIQCGRTDPVWDAFRSRLSEL